MNRRNGPSATAPTDDLELAEAEAEALEAAAAAAAARARVLRLRGGTNSDGGGTKLAVVAERDVVVETSDSDQTSDGDAPEAARDNTSEPVASSRTRRWLKRAGAVLAVLITLAMIAVSVYMVIEERRSEREQRYAAEYTAAARQGVTSLMSLNFSHAKDDVQRIIDNSTGQFRADFESSAADFTKVAEQSQVITDATVNATAIEKMTDHDATVLVGVTSRITNKQGAQENPRTWRLSVDVARDGDRVKMAKVDFVP
ncbi:hypothetical protein FK535_19555 [Mycolicibacterium sp. 018/SC-01/001]|uniref:hypothetical protein n=1 Tax=Mycolicibacterium sp. 018/SC-01/001 TaxID=2592069 RepID=UPI00117DA8DF|nr:hypothetical protein [Mycolicibacterium sp. 018/SC-01/001]TRW80240.1 hypothetical protein FK535_19555 [Mycolicibacterium sp. 018/SC-01/001]